MGALDAILVGIIAPAALILGLRLLFRVPADRLALPMIAGGIASALLAILPEVALMGRAVAVATRYWDDMRAAEIAEAAVTATIEEMLKVGVVYWLLARSTDLTWRRFAILAAWTGAGFAGIENLIYIFSQGGDVMIVRSFTASPMHVLNAIIAARLLWLGAQEKARDMTIAAFCLSIFLHASYNYLIRLSEIVGWMFLIALATIAVFACAALACRDERLTRASI